jgi:hypothetical protein
MTVYVIIVTIGLARLPGQTFETMETCWKEALWWRSEGHQASCHTVEVLEKRK